MPKSGDLFYPAYQISRFTSVLSGYIVTGVVAAPFVFLDWVIREIIACLPLKEDEDDGEIIDEALTKAQKALYAYDIPLLFSEVDIKRGSHRIYGCSFFGKRSYGIIATTAGTATSFAVSLATFTVAAALTIAAAATALSLIVVFGLLALIIAGAIAKIKQARDGTPALVESVANIAKGLI